MLNFLRTAGFNVSERKHLVDDEWSQHKGNTFCSVLRHCIARASEGIKKPDIYLTFITECEGTSVLMLCKKSAGVRMLTIWPRPVTSLKTTVYHQRRSQK